MLSEIFFQPIFRCPSKAGQVSLGRRVDSYPGDSIHQRGYFLHCFLCNTSLDFPLPWTLGCHTCWFILNRHNYTDRTAQPQDVMYTLYFVWVSDKKAGEHSGRLDKIFHALLEEQKHLILVSQISEHASSVRPSTWWEFPVSSCKARTSRKKWVIS